MALPFLRILLVEDEFLVALDLEQILLDAGHMVVGIASTAADAVRLARELKPELAFVDVHLAGGASGLEIARGFHDQGTPLPVFITSDQIVRKLPFGAGYLPKPYDPEDIATAADYLAQGLLRPPPTIICPRALHLYDATLERFSQPLG